MGMFDSVYTNIKCPLCGDEREQEVQFKLSIGRAYSPDLRSLRVGDVVGHMPPIARVEAAGFSTFECCPDPKEGSRSNDSLIVFEFGRLVSVTYPLPDEHEWAPLPRSRLWARRHAAAEEAYERRYRAWKEKYPEVAKKPLGRIAFAMTAPLMVNLDYAGIGRRLLQTGEVRGNYWRPSPGSPWKRRDGCPL